MANTKALKIGLLGGGQLARMLALEAHRLGVLPYVLSPHSTDPAAQATQFWIQGDPHNASDIKKFSEQVDVLTFESEFVNAELLGQLPVQLEVFPAPKLMALFQKRLSQKETLTLHQIPTAPFLEVKTAADLELAWKTLGPFVLKANFGGYDGNGTHYAHKKSDLAGLREKLRSGESFLAEKKIRFQKELALIFVRGKNGECFHLPLVETQQVNSRCDWVLGPVKNRHVTSFAKKFSLMLKKLNYVGVMGVELFLVDGKLLVNEIAPRVHNSGHFSQDAMTISQFALHLMAGLGHPLVPPELNAKNFVMTNLLGEEKKTFDLGQFSGAVHWYGKTEIRKGRKMGHVNYLGASSQALLKKSLSERKRSLR